MKIRYNREIISGAIFVVLSAVLWFLIPVQVQTLEKTPINAQTFPRIAIGGMFLCSVGLLLEGIFVREDFRRQGIASALLAVCRSWCRRMNCSEFASDCGISNTASLKFHLHSGFTEANRLICFVQKLKS